MPTVDLGSVDISFKKRRIAYTVHYEAQVRSIDGQESSAVPCSELKSPWIPRPAHFDINLALDIPVQPSYSIAQLSRCLSSAPLWQKIGYTCSSTILVSASQDARTYLRLNLTNQFSLLPDEGESFDKATGKIYRETASDTLQAPPGVSTQLLQNVTLHIVPLSPPNSSLQRYDSLFADDSAVELEQMDGDSEDPEFQDLINFPMAGSLASRRPDEYNSHILQTLDAAIRTSISTRRLGLSKMVKVKRGIDFQPLVEFSPAIWKPDGVKAFAMHAVFLPHLDRSLHCQSPEKVQLWRLLHRKLLVDAQCPKLEALGEAADPLRSCEGSDSMLLDDENSVFPAIEDLLADDNDEDEEDLLFGYDLDCIDNVEMESEYLDLFGGDTV